MNRKPAEELFYGIGILAGTIIILGTWLIIKYGFDMELNIGSFSGVLLIGVYYIYRGIKGGAEL